MQISNVQRTIARAVIGYFFREENSGYIGETKVYNFFRSGIPSTKTPVPVVRLPSDRLIDLPIGFADPVSLCWYLEEALGIPRIPRERRRRIPTVEDIQDLPVLANRHADFDMTIESFARGLATWLKRRHPDVLQRLHVA
ncbi:MAG: hypothetical protein HZC01_03965 [Candidatus Kerfeldbacteria bacterium]|nr:hypothetical protein [Candidatus Kerfeldbacteria bacterium]